MPGSNSETRGRRFCDSLGSSIGVQYYVGPIIILHGRITAREYVNWLSNVVRPIIHTLFLNNDAVLKTPKPPLTQLDLFSNGLKSKKVNFTSFPGQHNHQI
jgi:hypothetical protein